MNKFSKRRNRITSILFNSRQLMKHIDLLSATGKTSDPHRQNHYSRPILNIKQILGH